ncbi:hypothetical protein SESBI_05553 [Sesbania bispinosa]|nr:hypothetical protein SESBI_05553 [Sesbania bispinosa]
MLIQMILAFLLSHSLLLLLANIGLFLCVLRLPKQQVVILVRVHQPKGSGGADPSSGHSGGADEILVRLIISA